MKLSENEKQANSYDAIIEFLQKEKLKYLRPSEGLKEQFNMESKDQQIKSIEKDIERLTERLNKLKDKSPEEKYLDMIELRDSVPDYQISFVNEKTKAFEKLNTVACYFNLADERAGKLYLPCLLKTNFGNYKAGVTEMPNEDKDGVIVTVPFHNHQSAIDSFEYLTDREIEILFGGQCINR